MRREETELWELIRRQLQPVLPAMEDPSTEEVQVNCDGSLWRVTGRKTEKLSTSMPIDNIVGIIRLMRTHLSVQCDYDRPYISGTMPVTLWRFSAELPPMSLSPSFVLRKPVDETIPWESLVEKGFVSEQHGSFLRRRYLEDRANIVVSGATGSGKTTFSRSLLSLLKDCPPSERIVVLQDAHEITIPAENVRYLFTSSTVSMRDCVRHSLRLSPKRIIVGEVRDEAAIDLLAAANTGHGGLLATCHSNSAYDTLLRFEELVRMGGRSASRYELARTLHIVCHMINKHVVEVAEVSYDASSHDFKLHKI